MSACVDELASYLARRYVVVTLLHARRSCFIFALLETLFQFHEPSNVTACAASGEPMLARISLQSRRWA